MAIKAYIVAEHYEQFLDYIREHKLNTLEYRFVRDQSSLWGVHNIEIKCIGTYYNRHDWYKIRDIIEVIRATDKQT